MASLQNHTGDSLSTEQRTAHVQSLINRLTTTSPIYQFLLTPITLTSVTKGSVTTRLTLTSVHVNSRGGLHGAVSAAIVDFSTGLAIASWDGRAQMGASVNMHVSYLSSASVGDVVEVRAVADRVGGSLAYTTCQIVKIGEGGEEKVVSIGQHTKYVKLPGEKKT